MTRFAGKWIAVIVTMLWTVNAHAALSIEITRGVDIGTPIAIVPFSWDGPGKPAYSYLNTCFLRTHH